MSVRNGVIRCAHMAKKNGGKRQTALVTGASGGIGLELARALAKSGFDLVLVARRKDELDKLAKNLAKEHGIDATAIAKDLCDPKAADQLFKELSGQTIDVLVNNAGVGAFGKYWEIEVARDLQQIQLNITALVHLTKLFLEPMMERKRGRILNVASTAAFQPGPLMAVYYATKAFVLSYSEAIATELEGTGVTVTALCPGPTESGFQAAAKMQESGLFKNLPVADGKSVAEAGVAGMLKGKAIVVPGLMNKIGIQANRFSPRAVVRKVVKRMQDKRGGH